jgi:hypothetical protein
MARVPIQYNVKIFVFNSLTLNWFTSLILVSFGKRENKKKACLQMSHLN